jgi:hypothetical protein
MTEEMIAKLKTLAQDECAGDELNDPNADVVVDDFAGGNVDDAFSSGEHTGRVELAREILDGLNIDY